MAESFDATKATSDLKQLLNLTQLAHQNDAQSNDKAKVNSSKSIGYSVTSNIRKDAESEHSSIKEKEQMDHAPQNLTDSYKKDHTTSAKSAFKQKGKSDSTPSNGDKSKKQKGKPERQLAKGFERPSSSAAKLSQEEKRKQEKGQLHESKTYSGIKSGKKQDENSPESSNAPVRTISQRNGGGGKTDNSKSQNMQGYDRTNQRVINNTDNGSSSTLASKNLWDNLSREVQIKMDENKIFFLKRKNMRFPNAKYFCRLCEYHMDSVDICEKHIEDGRHCHRKEVNDMDSTLRNLPPPLSNHLDALTAAVELLYEEHGLKPEDRDIRRAIVQRLEERLQEKIPDIRLHMYGTSLTRMGLKTADINVNLYSTVKDTKLTSLLKDSYSLMKDRSDTGFINVHSDFSATVPALLLTDTDTGHKVTVTIHFYSALCTSELLSIYTDFDDRVVKLAVAFRYWAFLCGVDRHQVGFIPPIALNIMIVFFLQTVKPQVLPIINPPVVCGEDTGNFSKDEPAFRLKRNKAMKVKADLNNNMSVGELWVMLLKFYSIELDIPNTVISIRSAHSIPRTTKPWNSKKLAVEDPFMLKKNLTRMISQSYEFWQYTIRKVYHYFGLPRGPDGKSYLPNYDFPEKEEVEKESSSSEKSKQKENTMSSMDENTLKDEVKDEQPPKDEVKNEHPPKDEVKDEQPPKDEVKDEQPLKDEVNNSMKSSPNSNCGKSDSSLIIKSKDHFEDHPVEYNSSLSCLEPKDESPRTENDSSLSEINGGEGDSTSNVDKQLSAVLPSQDSPVKESFISSNADTAHDASPHKTSSSVGETIIDSQVEVDNNAVSSFALNIVNSIINKAVNLVSSGLSTSPSVSITESDSCQIVERNDGDNTLLSDKEDIKIPNASLCDQGSDTPKETNSSSKPEDVSSQETNDTKNEKYSFIAQIASKDCCFEFSKQHFASKREATLICTSCEKEGHHKNECPDDELPEILPIQGFTEHHHKVLEEALKKIPSEVGLSDFSKHQRQMLLRCLEDYIQMGFPGARLQLFGSSCNGFGFDRSDMDICMTFVKKRPNIDKGYCVERLASMLKLHKDLKNVQAISTAKVPIVKFAIKDNDLDGDISLYNTLAQENTRLLYSYSEIDSRVRVLGYTIKLFAQVCDIGDASRGSLSSYGYVLMMLYYLQQVQPPVIPVLQELHHSTIKPKNIIEGWDAWFMDDLKKLSEFWPEMGKNKMSASELWLGFLRFYVEEFNYRELVISIRQKEPLSRFEKLWNGFCLAIEDPFDLNHNLGSGLSRTMNTFILKTLINGRMLYGSPIDDNMDLFNKYQSPSDYFFDTELLSEARPPNSRGCRHCGKIGHMMRHCPASKKEREDEFQKHQPQRQHQPRHLQEQQQRHQQNLKSDQQKQQQRQQPQRDQTPQGQERALRKKQDAQEQHSQKQQQWHEQQKQGQKQNKPQQQQQHYQNKQHVQNKPQQQNDTPQHQSKPHQQQYSNKKQQSFQQQKQHEAQQLHKQLERDWLPGDSGASCQEHWKSGKGHNFSVGQSLSSLELSARTPSVVLLSDSPSLAPSTSLPSNLSDRASISSMIARQFQGLPLFASSPPQFNLMNNPSLRPSVPQNLNQRHPLPDGRMNFSPRFPPSLVPPGQRPRGILNQFPVYMGPPGLPPPPPGHSSPYYYNYNFNNSSNTMRANNSNNNGGPNYQRLTRMPPQNYSNMTPSDGPRSSGPAFLPHSGPPTSNAEAMNPVVQNLFASTQGKVMDARAMQPHLMKRN